MDEMRCAMALQQAQQLWDRGESELALSRLQELASSFACPQEAYLYRLRWHLALSQNKQALVVASEGWKRYRALVFADVMQQLLEEEAKLPGMKVSYPLRHRICNSYVDSYFAENVVNAVAYPHDVPQYWQMWVQGVSEVPALLRVCHDSLQRLYPSRAVHLLDLQSLAHWVELPGFIYDKFRKGILPAAHFTDVARCHLLFEHGGIWSDLTAFHSEPFPRALEKLDFFVFVHPERATMSNWFLSAWRGHPYMHAMKWLLEAYWCENDTLAHYHIFHGMFMALMRDGGPFAAHFAQMPTYSSEDPHQLGYYALKKSADDVLDKVMRMCFVHKLSHKENHGHLESYLRRRGLWTA